MCLGRCFMGTLCPPCSLCRASKRGLWSRLWGPQVEHAGACRFSKCKGRVGVSISESIALLYPCNLFWSSPLLYEPRTWRLRLGGHLQAWPPCCHCPTILPVRFRRAQPRWRGKNSCPGVRGVLTLRDSHPWTDEAESSL